MVRDKSSEALGTKVEELLSLGMLLLLRPAVPRCQQTCLSSSRGLGKGVAQAVLGLSDLKLAVALELDETDPQVRTSKINGEVGSSLLPSWVTASTEEEA